MADIIDPLLHKPADEIKNWPDVHLFPAFDAAFLDRGLDFRGERHDIAVAYLSPNSAARLSRQSRMPKQNVSGHISRWISASAFAA